MSTGATPSRSADSAAGTRLRASVIGLGAIGRGVAISLARRGHLPSVFDLRDTMLAALRAADARDPQYVKMLEVRASGFEASSERIDHALSTAAKDLDATTILADSYAVRLPLTEATKPLVREVFIRNGGVR